MGTDIPSGVTRTLTIDEAQNLEQAPPFSRQGDYARAVAEPAQKQLEKLARDYHAKHAETSYAVAFTKILTAPENRVLAKRAQQERLEALGVA